MAKKTADTKPQTVTEQPNTKPAPITYKQINLSVAETSVIQALNSQKNEIDKQIMATVQSVLDTREINQAEIVGGLALSEDSKSLSFTVRTSIDQGTF